jgi:hypothetical protein
MLGIYATNNNSLRKVATELLASGIVRGVRHQQASA